MSEGIENPDQQSLLEEMSEIAQDHQEQKDELAKFIREHKAKQGKLDTRLLEMFQRITHMKKWKLPVPTVSTSSIAVRNVYAQNATSL